MMTLADSHATAPNMSGTSKRAAPAAAIPTTPTAPADWRTDVLARVRRLIAAAVPGVVEQRKWGDVPVWSHGGILCTGETYQNVVKLTFAKGASLADPAGLFNASLEGKTRRAIDIRAGDSIDERALTALIRAAAAANASSSRAAAAPRRPRQRVARAPRASGSAKRKAT